MTSEVIQSSSHVQIDEEHRVLFYVKEAGRAVELEPKQFWMIGAGPGAKHF